MNHTCLTPQPQNIIALWPVLVFRPAEGRRLSWPDARLKFFKNESVPLDFNARVWSLTTMLTWFIASRAIRKTRYAIVERLPTAELCLLETAWLVGHVRQLTILQ